MLATKRFKIIAYSARGLKEKDKYDFCPQPSDRLAVRRIISKAVKAFKDILILCHSQGDIGAQNIS